MTLITILIGLGLEYFYGALDQLRNYSWFDRYLARLELRCGDYRFWNGPVGVLLTLAIPLLVLFLLGYLLGTVSAFLLYLFVVVVFIYCLGSSLNTLMDDYIAALDTGDKAKVREIEQDLVEEDESDRRHVIGGLFVRAHDHIFAIIFWFIVLGMLGALLYTLTSKLRDKFGDIHGGYGDAVQQLHKILMWPSARFLAIGFALAGSLVHALEAWGEVEGFTLDNSRDVIALSGLGALQYRPDDDPEAYLADVRETQALINRSLIVWLTVLGIMTIGGWLT